MTTTTEFTSADAIDYGVVLERVESETYLLSYERDAAWLAMLGIEPDAEFLGELNQLLLVGSTYLPNHPTGNPAEAAVWQAREQVLEVLLGPAYQHLPARFRPGPSSTMIRSIRCLVELGFIEANFKKLVYASPRVLQQHPKVIVEKCQQLAALGLNPHYLVKHEPNAIALDIKRLEGRIDKMTALGLDAAAIFHAKPRLIHKPFDDILMRVRRIEQLDLDAIAMINQQPGLLGINPDEISRIYAFLVRTVDLFKWHGTAKTLAESHPTIFTMNFQRLQIMRRIAAEGFQPDRSELSVAAIGNLLRNPIENLVAAFNELGEQTDVYECAMKAKNRRLNSAQIADINAAGITKSDFRKNLRQLQVTRALKSGNVPSRIKTMYIQYKS